MAASWGCDHRFACRLTGTSVMPRWLAPHFSGRASCSSWGSERRAVGADPAPHQREQPSWAKVGWCTALALVALWLASVVQQLTSHRREPPRRSREFFADGGAPAGLKAGAGLLAAEFRVVPPWLGGHDLAEDFSFGVVKPANVLWLLIAVSLIALGLFAAKRTRRRSDRLMIELAALMCVVGVISMSRITLEFDDYLFYWRITIAVFLVASCGIAIALVADRDYPGLRVAAATVLIAIIAGGFVKKTVNVVELRHQTAKVEAVGRGLAHQIGDEQGAERGAEFSSARSGMADVARRGPGTHHDFRASPESTSALDPRYGFHFGEQRRR